MTTNRQNGRPRQLVQTSQPDVLLALEPDARSRRLALVLPARP